MIDIDRDPEDWRPEVVALLRDRDRPAEDVARFVRATDPRREP